MSALAPVLPFARSSVGPLLAAFVLAALAAVSSNASAQGLLIPRDESVPPLALKRHTVEFEITDNGAVTHVTQVFENHTSTPLEATYYFAVPPGAVTTDFALWMNGERIRGEVLARDEARQIYENIVRRTRDPGLLEYVDGELFQASIFPVPPNGEQTVEIEFANVLDREANVLHYRYPIHESASREIPLLVVAGDIATSHPIASIYSPYHAIDESIRSGGRAARVTMEESGAGVAHDFELYIGLTGDDVGFSLLTHDADDGGDGYFMLTIAPSPELEDLEVLPKQVTLVVDTSGSMAGDKIEQARAMLRYCVENLEDGDTFQIIGFSSSVSPAFEEPVPATRENRRRAMAYIDGLRARGNTNISEALSRAMRDPASAERPHSILFVTDGLPTEGETDVDAILAIAQRGVSDGDRRVFAFGLGYDVNARLLDGLARRGRGETGYVRPNEDLSDKVGEFYDSVGAPLLTQIELDFGGVRVDEVYPNPLPDLYRDRDITVFGRYRADHSGAIVVRGRAAGREWVQEYGADFAAVRDSDTSFVGNLWARRRVDALLFEIEEQGQTQRRVDQVVALATEWGIVTPYTSYLAVDPSERRFAQPWDEPMWEGELPTPDAAPLGGVRRGGDGDLGAVDDFGTGFGTEAGGSGRSSRSRDSAQAASEAPMAARPTAPAPRQESGREAVEESITRAESRSSTTLSGGLGSTRRADGRTFEQVGGVWIEAGVSARVDERITYGSDAYFALLRDHPELREVLSLGERVRFELRGRIIEIVP